MEVATKSLPMACSLCGNLSSRKDDHCQFLGDLIVDILKRYEDDWILVFLETFLLLPASNCGRLKQKLINMSYDRHFFLMLSK